MDDPGKDDRPRGDRLTHEEMRVVGGAGVFDAYFGRGWFRNLVIYGIPSTCALLILAGIASSFVETSDTLLLYGQPVWIPGERTGLRVVVMDGEGEYLPITGLAMEISDPGRGRSKSLFDGDPHGTQAATVEIVPPDWPAGSYALEVRAKTTRQAKKASLGVRLDPSYAGEAGVLPRDLSTWRVRYSGETFMDPGSRIRVELVPEGGQIVSSLHNIVYVRTTGADGGPLPARVRLGLAEGFLQGDLPDEVVTDALGLGAFIVYPTFNALAIEVWADPLDPAALPAPSPAAAAPPPGPAGHGKIVLPIGPRGVLVRLITPNPEARKPFRIRVQTIGNEPSLFVDLYHGGTWKRAASARPEGRSTEVVVPASGGSGLHVVQAYSSPVPALVQRLPGVAPDLMSCSMSTAHVWMSGPGETDEGSLALVAGEVEGAGIDGEWIARVRSGARGMEGLNTGRAIAFLLARLDGAVFPPEVAASSRAADKARAKTVREGVRRWVTLALAIVSFTIVFGFCFLAFESWRHSRGSGREGAAAGEPASGQEKSWMRRQLFQMLMVAAVMAGMFALIAILVSYLRWQMG